MPSTLHRCTAPTLSTLHVEVWVWHQPLCIKMYSSGIIEIWKWMYGLITNLYIQMYDWHYAMCTRMQASDTIHSAHECKARTLSTLHTDVWFWHYPLCINMYGSGSIKPLKWMPGFNTIHPAHRCAALILCTMQMVAHTHEWPSPMFRLDLYTEFKNIQSTWQKMFLRVVMSLHPFVPNVVKYPRKSEHLGKTAASTKRLF